MNDNKKITTDEIEKLQKSGMLYELYPEFDLILQTKEIDEFKLSGQYKHIKSGKLYFVTGKVTNCTNSNNGQTMIAYERDGKHYVREEKEFNEKFIKIIYIPRPIGY